MKEIILSGKRGQGKVALVDDADYEEVSKYLWYAAKKGGYPSTGMDGTVVPLHTFLLGKTPKGMLADHRDRDVLNNQRANLRFATARESGMNRTMPNRFGLRGVNRIDNTWIAQMQVNGKKVYIGAFPSSHIAALAYDMWVMSLNPEYAQTNFKVVGHG